MESGASSGHWLTNRFVPEVLSPLMVCIATVIEERYLVDFYQNIAIAILLTGMVVAVVAISLLASFRRYMARKMKKVPCLAEQLEARNGTVAATAMLIPCGRHLSKKMKMKPAQRNGNDDKLLIGTELTKNDDKSVAMD